MDNKAHDRDADAGVGDIKGGPGVGVREVQIEEKEIDDVTVQKAIGDEMERRGVLLLAMAPLGHRALATRDATVAAPGDLRDLRVRVPAYPTALDLYTTLRARPASLSFAQSQAAIAAGELDA